MSRVRILLLVAIVVGAIIGFVIYKNISLPVVTIDTKDATFLLYNWADDKKIIQEVSASTKLRLHDGYYCGTAKDDKYDKTPICFTVYKKDISHTFSTGYSTTYLEELAVKEKMAAINTITQKYKDIIDGYIICTGVLYAKGDIYGTSIVSKPRARSDNSDIYKVVLKKTNDTWSIVKTPVLVLDKTTFSEIPVDILKKINEQKAC